MIHKIYKYIAYLLKLLKYKFMSTKQTYDAINVKLDSYFNELKQCSENSEDSLRDIIGMDTFKASQIDEKTLEIEYLGWEYRLVKEIHLIHRFAFLKTYRLWLDENDANKKKLEPIPAMNIQFTHPDGLCFIEEPLIKIPMKWGTLPLNMATITNFGRQYMKKLLKTVEDRYDITPL